MSLNISFSLRHIIGAASSHIFELAFFLEYIFYFMINMYCHKIHTFQIFFYEEIYISIIQEGFPLQGGIGNFESMGGR